MYGADGTGIPAEPNRRPTFREGNPRKRTNASPQEKECRKTGHGQATDYGKNRETALSARPSGAHIRGGFPWNEKTALILVLGDAGYVVGGALGSAGGPYESVGADGTPVRRRLAADAGRRRVAIPERVMAQTLQIRMAMAAWPRSAEKSSPRAQNVDDLVHGRSPLSKNQECDERGRRQPPDGECRRRHQGFWLLRRCRRRQPAKAERRNHAGHERFFLGVVTRF